MASPSACNPPQVNEQWGLYDGFDPKLEPVLRNIRRAGRHMPIMNVVPPGLDFSNLKASSQPRTLLPALPCRSHRCCVLA